MVEKGSKVLVFDGVKPEAVVFGDSLGEGKSTYIVPKPAKQLT